MTTEPNLLETLERLGFKYKKGSPAGTPGYVKCFKNSILKVHISARGCPVLEHRVKEGIILSQKFPDLNLFQLKVKEIENQI